MELDLKLPTETIYEEEELNIEEEEEEDEEFYEKIEAPKFVDLTLPDPYRPDDRFWFCSRVGCDQKHEQEMDAEAIYKKFLLRVMAARSPNIKLRKALATKTSGTYAKCPLSAPAKSSKSRVSRLAMVTSIPKKLVIGPKEEVRPLPKITSTPKPKSKQVAAKYMTTPRNQKCLSSHNSFRSVQNPKLTCNSSLPKNRIVAKALVFHSPQNRKAICVKTSVELRTPLTKICEEIKKLEIASQKNGVGRLIKSSKDVSDEKKRLSEDPSIESRTPLTTRRKGVLGRSRKSYKEIRCSNKKVLPVDPSKQQLGEAKSLKFMKSNKKVTLQCNVSNGLNKVIGDASSNNGGNGDEDLLKNGTKKSGILSIENSDASSGDALRGETNFLPNSEKNSHTEVPEKEDIKESELEIPEKEDKKECELEMEECSNQLVDGDDKENAPLTHDSRYKNCEENNKKGAQIIGKNLKAGALEVKHTKPKPTNPKPFRLRTDERGILKEANLERKFHLLAPQRDARPVSKIHYGKSMKKHGDDMKKQNEHCDEQSESSNSALQGSERKAEIVLHKVENKQTRTNALKTFKSQMIQKTANITPQKSFRSYSKDKANRISDQRSGETNSCSLGQQFVGLHRIGASRKAQLSVIKETSSKPLRPKEAIKPGEKNPTAVTASAFSTSRSSSRGRRPVSVASSHITKELQLK